LEDGAVETTTFADSQGIESPPRTSQGERRCSRQATPEVASRITRNCV